MTAWPDVVAATPAVAVIERALARGHLAHSLLFHGENTAILESAAVGLADRLLNPPGTPRAFPPKRHPDFFSLRPEGKLRQIKIGEPGKPAENTMRGFLSRLDLTPQVGRHKVGVIFEADRLNTAAANAFLKTLEEPPPDTTLMLLTQHPYALLPTIRSRCLHFRFAITATPLTHPDLAAWRDLYESWLRRLVEGVPDKKDVAEQIFTLYALITRFESMLASATAEQVKKDGPAEGTPLTDDEREALETGIAVGVRQSLLAEIEFATRRFVAAHGSAAAELRIPLIGAIRKLEESAALLRANLGTTAALEEFFLASLRLWAAIGVARRAATS